jgi:hypothetical protein
MKLTQKTVKHEVEKTESVCEITQAEFDQICAKEAARFVAEFIGPDAAVDDITAGLELTTLFARFVANLDNKLFNDHDNDENPDNKEEK